VAIVCRDYGYHPMMMTIHLSSLQLYGLIYWLMPDRVKKIRTYWPKNHLYGPRCFRLFSVQLS
jgi:hypothetical protein